MCYCIHGIVYVVMEMLSPRGESGSGKSHLCEKLMVEILKREKVTALWTKELFKVTIEDMRMFHNMFVMFRM